MDRDKNVRDRAEAILDHYVSVKRKELEAQEHETTCGYDTFATAARVVNPAITDEQIDALFFANYNFAKYRDMPAHWWENGYTIDKVVSIMERLLTCLPVTFASQTDILESAGYVKPKNWRGKNLCWTADMRHAFDLLVTAGELEKTTIRTCGKSFIHLYRAA